MLVQNDPFRDFDSVFNRLSRSASGAASMPIDAYRRGNDVWVHLEVPGVARDGLDLSVERGMLTVKAHRSWSRQEGDRPYFAERHQGVLKRQIQLGEGLSLDAIEADLHDGVLTLRIPVAEKAQPKRIEIGVKSPLEVGVS